VVPDESMAQEPLSDSSDEENIGMDEVDAASECGSSEFGDECFSHFKLLEYLRDYGSYSTFRVTQSAAEIVYMALSLAISENFTQTSTVNLFKLLNVILNTSIFPETVYKFQSYFNPGMDMKQHYTCNQCGHYLGVKSNSSNDLTCENCSQINSLKGYAYEYTFITLSLESQLRDMFDSGSINISDLHFGSEEGIYLDIHSGSLCKKFNPGISQSNTRDIALTCTFNADGAPLGDTKLSFTPIYLMVNEVDISKRGKNLILAGLWYGKIKPRMEIFLQPFVESMTELSKNGIKVKLDGKMYTITLYASSV
jgi:ribosomal protein L37AE/L43A